MASNFNTLEATDNAVREGVLLLKDAVLSYASIHGLNDTEIHKRLIGLGAEISRQTVNRTTSKLRKEGKLEERAPSRSPEARWKRAERERLTNAQNEQMSGPVLEALRQQVKSATKRPAVKAAECEVMDESIFEPPEPKRIKVVVTKMSAEELNQARKESADNAISTGHEYGQQLIIARDALADLKAKVKSISLYRGTRFLEEVRESNPLAAQDSQLLRECANLIIEIGAMTSSSNGPEVLSTAE